MKAALFKKVRKRSAEFTLYSITRNITLFLAFIWTFFHFATESPNVKIDSETSILIHLAFAVLISILSFPTLKKIPNNKVYYLNLVIASIFTLSVIYLYMRMQYNSSEKSVFFDIFVCIVFIFIFYEAVRRAEKLGIFLFATLSLAAYYFYYVTNFFSNNSKEQLFDLLYNKTIFKNGFLSSPIEISENYIFIFAILAALFAKSGAARYFTILPFVLLGNTRGMAARSSIVLSAFYTLFDGPRNTYMLHENKLKEKIEKDSTSKQNLNLIEFSYNLIPQIMPPILGVAAFMVIEYSETSYADVLKAIFLPAVTIYICLLFFIYNSSRGATRRQTKTRVTGLLLYALGLLFLIIISGAVYYLFSYLKLNFSDVFLHQIFVFLIIFYILMTAIEAKIPDLETYKFEKENFRAPKVSHLIIWGIHYITPISFFISMIFTEPDAPDFAAYLTSLLLVIIIITRKPIKAVLRREGSYFLEFLEGAKDIKNAMIHAAFAMSHIAITLAIAGFVTGILISTGINNLIIYYIEYLYFQKLFLILPTIIILCMLLSSLLGPVLSFIISTITLMPVISGIMDSRAIETSPITLNLFILFYCLIGPVLAPFIIKFFKRDKKKKREFYDELRIIAVAMLLPLFFLFNERLLLIDINSFWSAAEIVSRLLAGCLIICCSVSGYFILKNRKWQNYALFFAAILMINPKLMQNVISPEYENYPGNLILEKLEEFPEENKIKISLQGEDYTGEERVFDYIMVLGKARSAEKRLEAKGIEVDETDGGEIIISEVRQDSSAENLGIEPGFVIKEFGIKVKQKYKNIPYIASGLLIILILVLQVRKILPKPLRKKTT